MPENGIVCTLLLDDKIAGDAVLKWTLKKFCFYPCKGYKKEDVKWQEIEKLVRKASKITSSLRTYNENKGIELK